MIKKLKIPNRMKIDSKISLPRSQIFLLGMLGGAGAFFGTVENGQFNTWINSVIKYDLGGTWDWWYVPLMTTFSAIMGLIFLLVWGAISDKTTSRWGKRRPFILGGIIAGLAMILYAFSGNFWICFVLDVLVVGIFMNALLAANKALIPDMTKQEERGRVNSYINIISGIFSFGSIAIFLVMDGLFTSVTPKEVEYLNIIGHIIILIMTGGIYITISIVCFFFIKEPEKNIKKDENSNDDLKWYQEIANSFRFSELVKEKEFFKILIATLIFNIGSKMFLPWIFEFVSALPLDFSIIAVVLVEFIFLGFIISIFLGKLCDRIGRKKPLIISIIIGCIGFFMVPIVVATMNLVLLIIMVALILFNLNGVTTILSAWTQDLLPRGKRGQFLGINNMSSTVNQMIGVWLGGLIYSMFPSDQVTGISWQIFFATFLFLASIPFFLKVKESLPVTSEIDVITPSKEDKLGLKND